MTPATTNATNPSVGPTTLHRHGLLRVPHCTHTGTNAIAASFVGLLLLAGHRKRLAVEV
jgi:hypothetical protein